MSFAILHGGSQEGGVSKNVKDVLAGRNENGFPLANMDTVDVGLPPKAHHNDEGVAVEVDLLGHLDDHTVHDKIRAVNQLACRFRRVIRCAVLRPYLIVNCILSLFDV